MASGSRRKLCDHFDKFHHCRFGGNCIYEHKRGDFRQEFFLGTIQNIQENRIKVMACNGRTREFCHLERTEKDFGKEDKPGDVVVFQASSFRKTQNLPLGRIAANLKNFQAPQGFQIESLRTDGFTIDPPGTKVRDDALTIEECADHDECTVFGIHVVAAAVSDECERAELPIYQKRCKPFWCHNSSFDRQKLMLALSIYEHSSEKNVRGPVFTPLVVEQNYTHHDKQLYKDKMDVLWSHFVKYTELESIFIYAKHYIADFPESWREYVLIDEIMKKYSTAITKFVAKKCDCHFIAKSDGSKQWTLKKNGTLPGFKDQRDKAKRAVEKSLQADETHDDPKVETSQDYSLCQSRRELPQDNSSMETFDVESQRTLPAFKDLIDKAKFAVERSLKADDKQDDPKTMARRKLPQNKHSTERFGVRSPTAGNRFDNDIEQISVFLANAMVSLRPTRIMKERFYPEKFERDVINSKDVCDKMQVKSTSPLRDFQHFINQQIVIRRMLGLERQLYSKKDLLGILSIRYRKPRIVKPFVRDIVKNEIKLEYAGLKVDKTLYEIDILDFSPTASPLTDVANDCKHILKLTGLTCNKQHYCNRNLCFIKRQDLASLMEKIKEHGAVLPDTRKTFIAMCQRGAEEESPYSEDENGTILTMQRGVELQLQISNDDACERNDLGLRILRVGEGCHLCLTHLNYPEKAFMSDRKDIRSLIHRKLIDEWKQKRRKVALESFVLKNVDTTWEGNYFSGGHFKTTKEGRVAKGDFVCIRKEMSLPTGEIDHVWTCHGVINRVNKYIVYFLVCSLSQPHSFESHPGSKSFIVEVVRNPVDEP